MVYILCCSYRRAPSHCNVHRFGRRRREVLQITHFTNTTYQWFSVNCSISIAKEQQILQSCTKPSIYHMYRSYLHPWWNGLWLNVTCWIVLKITKAVSTFQMISWILSNRIRPDSQMEHPYMLLIIYYQYHSYWLGALTTYRAKASAGMVLSK